MRYTAVIKEMNVLFSGQIMVVDENAIVIQAIPMGGSMFPQEYTEERIQSVSGVEETASILFITPIGIGGIIQPVPVNFSIGIPVEHWHLILDSIPLKDNVGHFPTNESSNEVVIGASLADQYNWTVGKKVTMLGHELEIAGILDTKMALLNRCIIMPLELAYKLYPTYNGSVNIITVKPVQGYSLQNLTGAIESKLPYVKALTEDERNDMIQPIIAQVEVWNVGIETVVFIMSLILVMTVTIMNVSERRRDFATLDAIGAPLSYVFRIIILETLLIGILGGILGIALGSLAALTLASLYTNIPLAQFFPTFYEIIPPLYMLEVFTAIVTVCCIGGIIPAINATRMRIAEVLRAEY
jgi:putative ABC transport system permease protein